MKIRRDDFRVKPGDEVELDEWPTLIQPAYKSKKHYQSLLREHVDELSRLRRRLYACNRRITASIATGAAQAPAQGPR